MYQDLLIHPTPNPSDNTAFQKYVLQHKNQHYIAFLIKKSAQHYHTKHNKV